MDISTRRMSVQIILKSFLHTRLGRAGGGLGSERNKKVNKYLNALQKRLWLFEDSSGNYLHSCVNKEFAI